MLTKFIFLKSPHPTADNIKISSSATHHRNTIFVPLNILVAISQNNFHN